MVNRLTQIYTRTGDEGKTGLGDGTRVAKFSARIECLGSVDELNSIIGLILTENVSQKNILKKINQAIDLGWTPLISTSIIKTKFLLIKETPIQCTIQIV